MRAVIATEPGDESVLKIVDRDPATLGPNDVRIRVDASAVNRADLLQRQGLYPPPKGVSDILGLECAGEVVEIGNSVAPWRQADRVMALLPGGGYAEDVVVDAGSVMAVPADYSDLEAGATPEVFLTAFLNIFLLGQPPEGARVLVHGGGSGVGTAAISLCKEAGFQVLVTAGSDGKCQRCLDHGADVAINYRQDEFTPAVLDATGKAGVDVILDCVGGKYLGANLKCMATGGALIVIGLMGGARAELDLSRMLVRRLRLVGSTLRARSSADKATFVRAFRERFGAALDAGRIRPAVDQVFDLEDVADAHRLVKSGEHFGKVALRIS